MHAQRSSEARSSLSGLDHVIYPYFVCTSFALSVLAQVEFTKREREREREVQV